MANMSDLSKKNDDFAISESNECSVDGCSTILPSQTSLSIITRSVRSLNCNFSGFPVLMAQTDHSFDILVLTECRSSRLLTLPTLNGYRSSMTTRNLIQNDGALVYLIWQTVTVCC